MDRKIYTRNSHYPNGANYVEAGTLAESITAVRAAKIMKSKVPQPHEILVRAAGDQWQLEVPLYYYLFNQEWLVPKGFITDFASVPRPFWFMYPPWRDDYGPAAILHDWHRRTKIVTKKEADGIFYECMKLCGVDLFTRVTFYRAVRAFAWTVGG